MKKEEITTFEATSTAELMVELRRLEKEIDLKIMKYNLINKELCRRFPVLEQTQDFRPKVLSKGEIQI